MKWYEPLHVFKPYYKFNPYCNLVGHDYSVEVGTDYIGDGGFQYMYHICGRCGRAKVIKDE
jgi:hypothetical protein